MGHSLVQVGISLMMIACPFWIWCIVQSTISSVWGTI